MSLGEDCLLLEIKSNDIDKAKVTEESLQHMKCTFPHRDTDMLARYLIARDNKVSKATKLLELSERWRTKHWPILKLDCIDEIKKGKVYLHGYDKEGRPLIVFRSKLHDITDRNTEEMAKMVLWFAEHAVSRLPPNRSKYTVLIDQTDAGKQHDTEFLKLLANLFQTAHPERLHCTLIYPCGMWFWCVWNIAKWFLEPHTRANTYPCVRLATVRERIDDHFIPQSMGGKSMYQFSVDDYNDPYPEEVIQAALEKRENKVGSGDAGVAQSANETDGSEGFFIDDEIVRQTYRDSQ